MERNMERNQIFNSLLHLSGLADDADKIIALMAESGHQVSINQLRDWRRGVNSRNYRRVPDYALTVIFDYLFEMKRSHQGFFASEQIVEDIK